MTDNFDLRKYLVENKVTTNSKMLKEAKTYTFDLEALYSDGEEDVFEDYQETVNEYLVISAPELQESGVDFETLTALVGKYGTLLFEVEITGLDPSTDGIESFYKVKDDNALSEIAKIYAESEEFYELSDQVQQGGPVGFMIVTYDYSNESVVVPLEPGFEKIKRKIPTSGNS